MSLLPTIRELYSRQPQAYYLAPWDTEWVAEGAAGALRYFGRNYPECLENLRVLDEHEEAGHGAAMAGDQDAYLEAPRAYVRAGRGEALRTCKEGA